MKELRRGYLRIKIVGSNQHKFFASCRKLNIRLWNVEKTDINVVYANIYKKDYESLKTEDFKGSLVSIDSKKGIPFLYQRFHKRYGFLVGAIALMLFYYASVSYVWNIEVYDNQSVKDGEILLALSQIDIKIGTKLSDIDCFDAKYHLMLSFDKLSYAAVNIVGNKVSVQISEATEAPEFVDRHEPTSIIAGKTALIDTLVVRLGRTVKNEGETVLKGETIVSAFPISEITGEFMTAVHASAEVWARTWDTHQRVLLDSVYEKEYTENETVRYYICIGNFKFTPFSLEAPYENYDKTIENKEIFINNSFSFPISLAKESYLEYNLIEKTLTEDEATEILLTGAENYLKQGLVGEVLDIDYNVSHKGDLYYMSVASECLEDIGIEERING